MIVSQDHYVYVPSGPSGIDETTVVFLSKAHCPTFRGCAISFTHCGVREELGCQFCARARWHVTYFLTSVFVHSVTRALSKENPCKQQFGG